MSYLFSAASEFKLIPRYGWFGSVIAILIRQFLLAYLRGIFLLKLH